MKHKTKWSLYLSIALTGIRKVSDCSADPATGLHVGGGAGKGGERSHRGLAGSCITQALAVALQTAQATDSITGTLNDAFVFWVPFNGPRC